MTLGVLQENYEQIDAHENDNRPEVMNPDEETSKESDKITTNNKDNLEEKNDEGNDGQETRDEMETDDDDGKFQVVFFFTSTTLLMLGNFNTFTSHSIFASNVIFRISLQEK